MSQKCFRQKNCYPFSYITDVIVVIIVIVVVVVVVVVVVFVVVVFFTYPWSG